MAVVQREARWRPWRVPRRSARLEAWTWSSGARACACVCVCRDTRVSTPVTLLCLHTDSSSMTFSVHSRVTIQLATSPGTVSEGGGPAFPGPGLCHLGTALCPPVSPGQKHVGAVLRVIYGRNMVPSSQPESGSLPLIIETIIPHKDARLPEGGIRPIDT